MRWQNSVRAVTIAAALLLTSTAAQATTQEPELNLVAANGILSVCGKTLCNNSGAPVQLRGMSTHGLQWYSQCVNDQSLDALARDWQADVLRISMYIQEGGYEEDPAKFTEMVDQYVVAASQ